MWNAKPEKDEPEIAQHKYDRPNGCENDGAKVELTSWRLTPSTS